jgi:hypothetical protein
MTSLESSVTLKVVASPMIVILTTLEVPPKEHLKYRGLYYKSFTIVNYDRKVHFKLMMLES